MATKLGSSLARSENSGNHFQAILIKRCQYVNFTATSTVSQSLHEETSLITLFNTQDCWVKIVDASGTAVNPGAEKTITDSMFMPGGIKDFIGVPPGLTDPRVAVVSNGANGVLYIGEGE